MKVLHVIARMNVGGTARYVGRLVESDSSAVLATGYVQGAEAEDDCVGRLPVMRVAHMGRALNPVQDILALFALRKIIRSVKPDLVHSHTFKAGLLARLVGGNFKRVHTFHGHLFDDASFSGFQKKVITFAERFLAGRTHVLVSVGKKVGVELRQAGVGSSGDWVSIAPGVDPLPKVERSIARKSLGYADDRILVGWMARVTSVKNPMLMIEVTQKMPLVSFVVAGGGDMLEEVKASAPSNVSVIGWADASVFWSGVDIALSTSDNEGMPVALIEAQLAGIPVVCTDVGSNGEVVEAGVTGFVVEKDVDSIVSALSKLVESSELRKSFGKAAIVRAGQEFGVVAMIEKHNSLYKGLLK
jgi:glycosyltransferase involved in cell wall biosynthesis